MNMRELFRGISDFMDVKFKMSYQIKHKTLRGDVREGTLGEFLSNGRLPLKYGVGHGEVASSNSPVSKQSDLVIFDQLNGAPLFFETDVRVFPVEIVCGLIEVKSGLSKTELDKGLNNIKSVKEISRKNRPFGIVFGYSLLNNSLNSLKDNLIEWEVANPNPAIWPELVVVNGEGIIYHSTDGISLTRPVQGAVPVYRELNKETFFSFYSFLIDFLEEYQFQPFSLGAYYISSSQYGNFRVFNHDNLYKNGKVAMLSKEFIERVFTSLPEFVPEQDRNLTFAFYALFDKFGYLEDGMKVRIYNPENEAVEFDDAWLKNPSLFENNEHLSYVKINNYLVIYPVNVVTDDDVEIIPDKKPEDL